VCPQKEKQKFCYYYYYYYFIFKKARKKGGPLLLYITQPKPSKSTMDKFSGFHYHSTFCKYGTVHLRWIPGNVNWPSGVDSRFSRANGGASAWNPAWILEGGLVLGAE
jgi:hypothetical protein